MDEVKGGSGWFQRLLLPGFAFKAVVIGGGYATGREIAEFFLPSGPWGGIAALVVATVLWSAIAALTFVLARAVGAYDYRTFFQALLGRAWFLFEIVFIAGLVLILTIFGAAAGEIGAAMFGWPQFIGSVLLAAGIVLVVTFGNESVEAIFKYVSFLLYGIYAIFFILSLSAFGDRIAAGFSIERPAQSWLLAGVGYAGYNVIGAVVILPVLRHLRSQRDAVVSGLIAGPLAMAPAIVFFVCMIAFYPAIASETLPSDHMLRELGAPWFHVLFQFMIFAALLESGAGAVHAVNERIAGVWKKKRGTRLGRVGRATIATSLLVLCMFAADRVGMVELIASGYRGLAGALLLVYVAPLFTVGIAVLLRAKSRKPKEAADVAA